MSRNRKIKKDEQLIQEFEVRLFRSFISKPKYLLRITNKRIVLIDGNTEVFYTYENINKCDIRVSESFLQPDKWLNIGFYDDSMGDLKILMENVDELDYDPFEECLMLINTFLNE